MGSDIKVIHIVDSCDEPLPLPPCADDDIRVFITSDADNGEKEIFAPGEEGQRVCETCRVNPATLRRCTHEYLCTNCRRLVQHRLISNFRAKKEFYLMDEEMCDLRHVYSYRGKHKWRLKLFWRNDVQERAHEVDSLRRKADMEKEEASCKAEDHD